MLPIQPWPYVSVWCYLNSCEILQHDQLHSWYLGFFTPGWPLWDAYPLDTWHCSTHFVMVIMLIHLPTVCCSHHNHRRPHICNLGKQSKFSRALLEHYLSYVYHHHHRRRRHHHHRRRRHHHHRLYWWLRWFKGLSQFSDNCDNFLHITKPLIARWW